MAHVPPPHSSDNNNDITTHSSSDDNDFSSRTNNNNDATTRRLLWNNPQQQQQQQQQQPRPRDNHATLWMTCNHNDTALQDLQDFFRMAEKSLDCSLMVVQQQQHQQSITQQRSSCVKVYMKKKLNNVKDEDDDDDSSSDDTLLLLLWKGWIYGDIYPEDNVGRYAIFHTTTEIGCEIMVKCVSIATWGYMNVIFHDRVEIDLQIGYKFISTTGFLRRTTSDDDDDEEEEEGYNNNDNDENDDDDDDEMMGHNISTRFQLQRINGSSSNSNSNSNNISSTDVDIDDVARCQISYRDRSNDPSVGPTIECIEVRKDERGKDYLPILWFWVQRFIIDNFTILSLSNDAPSNNTVMIKATKLQNVEIEKKKKGDSTSVTDKDFFYNHAGFSVRKQIHILQQEQSTIISNNDIINSNNDRRPIGTVIDEEAVLYLPLLSREQIKHRMENGENFGKATTFQEWPTKRGKRICNRCKQIKLGLLRCRQCCQVYYCNQICQKKDWKIHKQWCYANKINK